MDAARIVFIAAAIVFVVGAGLVIVGVMTPPSVRAAADKDAGFWPIIKNVLGKMLKILFPPAGKPTPPAYQRRIAAGVLLMLLGAILAVGAITAGGLTGDDDPETDPTPTPSSTASTST